MGIPQIRRRKAPYVFVMICLYLILSPFPKVRAATQSAGYSIQAVLDAAHGERVFLPPGEHVLTESIVIRHNGASLYGPGRIVQSNRNASFFEIHDVHSVSLRHLTLLRPEARRDTRVPAILARGCRFLTIEQVDIRDTHSPAAVIRFEKCRRVDVLNCRVNNYMTLSVDDRTNSSHYGYAFNCIDGTGILINECRDVLLQGNRIVEENLRPTREMKERHQLGEFVKRAPKKGSLISQQTWKAGYVNNWHQGSAITITGPETTAFVRLVANHIENAAQGIDIHADYVTINGNIVVNSFIGMKAMHGSRHVLISNNQFIRNDLWSIGLMPGSAAHTALAATKTDPGQSANVDGGSVIANNIITDFGYGDSHWIWDPNRYTCAPILLDRGQEFDDPPLRDIVICGNVIYNTGRDMILVEGKPRIEPPRYRYAVFVSKDETAPKGIHFQGNLFHSGTEGISNIGIRP